MVAVTNKQNVAHNTTHDDVVAVDLGSNSFHLLLARRDQHGFQPIIAMARKVQLGRGGSDNRLCQQAIARGLTCLHEFAPYTRGRNPGQVWIVGTHALREADNKNEFIGAAEEILGHAIDVISGEEEASLVYQGVDAMTPIATGLAANQPKMVIDIGGGSTEIIAGKGTKISKAVSLPIGCVSYLNYFPGGDLTEQAFNKARAAACDKLATVAGQFKGLWQDCIGCSGTLLAVDHVLQCHLNLTRYAGITPAALQALRSALLTFNTIESVDFQGLSDSRRGVFASGLAIVQALFECLAIDRMQPSNVSLREGLAWQLLQRARVSEQP